MNAITWLHISDLHFSVSQSYDTNVVIKPLLEDIENHIQSGSIKLDFIIISGDIASKSLPEEYNKGKNFLDELLKITKIPKDKLFLVPGNHDIDRNTNPIITSSLKGSLLDRNHVNNFRMCLAQSIGRLMLFLLITLTLPY